MNVFLVNQNRGASSNRHSNFTDSRQLCDAIKNFSLNGSDNGDCSYGVTRSRRTLPQPEIKKICEVLNKLLNEKNHKVGVMISVIPPIDFRQPLNMALRAVRTTFRPELQLIAVCRNIMDPIQTPPVKDK
ncbi:hypothetical protein DICVIV_13991 [Dictyocaulus viviparus]|uniref:Uncharacterized protein n=1 Tax=Dictyocaulus viviparus TaxID=29172 RepID=A0A0D8XC82_DICVI|nr:hypothetical protein DICVIV_13991 [Dictyocaulus viviparus]